MAQVNKYTDRAAYAVDTERLSTKSAVSYIESEAVTIYDGVNIVVGKPAATVGDLAVFDKTDGSIKFIKSATIVKAQIPATLTPLAVVYARHGERLLVVSLDNATYAGLASVRWAHSYEVALSGFNLIAGGTFVLKIYTTEYSFTYAAGATLTDIAANIAANLPNYNGADYGGWKAVATDGAVIMTSDTYSTAYSTIDAVSGCTITRTPEDKNYQTTLTGSLISGMVEYIRRNNRVNATLAIGNPERSLQYYSVNGSTKTGQKPGSPEIIRESVFTEADNPELVAAYPTYKDYLLTEHIAQYPVAYGTMLRDGKMNTAKIGGLRFVNIHGATAPCYPAAVAALNFGVSVEGATTGLEAGAWWLPSSDEIYLLMYDRASTSADRESDPINRTLSRMGETTLYGGNYSLWTSCECNSYFAFVYYNYMGYVGYGYKHIILSVRPVSAL